MRLLCVGRHEYLAAHVASLFREPGVQTEAVVGLDCAAELVRADAPDLVLCEYDLLATNSLGAWERDPVLGHTPVVAVSLTRRPQEACAFDVNGIAGFLYLPTLDRSIALRTLASLAARRAVAEPPRVPAAFTLPTAVAAAPADFRA